jgi:hypothetical protein
VIAVDETFKRPQSSIDRGWHSGVGHIEERREMKRFLAATFIGILALTAAFADTLTLKSGAAVAGTYLGGNSRDVKFVGADGKVVTYSVGNVASLSFGDAAPVASAVSAPWPITAPRPTAAAMATTIPDGTVLTVRMIDAIDSSNAAVGDRFRASLDEALVVNGRELAPRGADAFVQLAKVDQAGRITGREEIAIELASVTIAGRETAVTSNFAELSSKSKTMQTAKTAGGGAAIGALIGAIAGGGKGAAIGVGVGAGAGTVYSGTRGTSVKVPSETVLTFVTRDMAAQ